MTPRATQASYGRRQDEARLAAKVQENLAAQGLVKAFRLESSSLASFLERNAQLAASVLRLHFLSALVEHSANMGIYTLRVIIVGIGAYMAFTGRLTVGELAAFQPLFINLTWGVFEFTQYVPQLVQAGGGMERLEEVLRERPQVNDAPGARSLPRLTREIAFQEVSFGYGGDRLSLDRVSFSIPRGRSVAFVGPSGSGKSTVLNLILRFYDPSSGTVTCDGRDLRQVTRESLCQRLGVVFQDNLLFSTSIRENIRLGRPAASDEEVEEAARAAELHSFIAGLPQGYDTLVGEGEARLSGGQRQRLGIARAILRDPEILLLDEATSALDPTTEAAINATLEKLARHRTAIWVTHRLSAAMNMDHLFVLERGRVVEEGTHKELLNRKGVYYRMWREFTLELTQNAVIGDWRAEAPSPARAVSPPELAQRLGELEAEVERQQQEVQRLSAINQRWAQLAGTDRLTGLPNKIAFLQALVPQELQQARRRGEPVGFILLSGDNVGSINETYGRDAGDQVLRGLAQFLQAALKGEEQLGHIDGTHFAVVFHPAGLEETRQRAEQLRIQVAGQAFACAHTAVWLTVSAGVTSVDSRLVDDPRTAAEEVFGQLNDVLYAAKKAGGDCVEVEEVGQLTDKEYGGGICRSPENWVASQQAP
ncbi:MAG: ATP-binding cassette domain-containing protein [Candidatus Latescibacteria bacterium]|nr:ATP-binding cassette domain-containing protein [Candidatus Latescibacterota bacterium]